MRLVTTAMDEVRRLDLLAAGESGIHRLDPRAKIVTTLCFIIAVVSFDRYRIAPLLPFVFYPLALTARARIPFSLIGRKVLIPLPFLLLVGLFNPLIDRAPLLTLGGVTISAGIVSLCSILLKGLLTIGAGFVLLATTGMIPIARGLAGMKVPDPFVTQLLFLYRYLFVLSDEARRSATARSLRSFGERGEGIRSFAPLVGTLLLRTFHRAERIHNAMLSRGFSGRITTPPSSPLTPRDLLFTGGWVTFFVIARVVDLPGWLGRLVTGSMP